MIAWWRVHSTVLGASMLLAVATSAAEGPQSPPVDRSLRILEKTRFAFPAKLRQLGIISGEVRLMLNVDAQGELTDHLFVAFTHHEFANEVSRTVPHWRFEPAIVGGRRVASTLKLSVRFQAHGLVAIERRDLADPSEATGAFMFRARELHELDTVPRRLVSVVPPTPVDNDEVAVTGRARIDFYIDETGAVRMPVVVTADDERLGWVALAAVLQWRFEPPRRGGHPVLARASQVFVFQTGT
jgi:outer membrane biosynthesis protein TonB